MARKGLKVRVVASAARLAVGQRIGNGSTVYCAPKIGLASNEPAFWVDFVIEGMVKNVMNLICFSFQSRSTCSGRITNV
ncbi:hypothetical protein BYT27DRAFT_7196021 [Phlegmacium glaucopus]|nr:hypothetical protein BYT27DRAFT_7196021 [Phlegmacium glaucopus]